MATGEKELIRSLSVIINNINNPILEPTINYEKLTNATINYVSFDHDCTTINKFKGNVNYKKQYVASNFNIENI